MTGPKPEKTDPVAYQNPVQLATAFVAEHTDLYGKKRQDLVDALALLLRLRSDSEFKRGVAAAANVYRKGMEDFKDDVISIINTVGKK